MLENQETTSQAQAFFQEYRDIITLHVFQKESAKYEEYINKLIDKQSKLLEKPLDKKNLYLINLLEEQIKVMLSFLVICETTLEVFQEKCLQHLTEWEHTEWEIQAWRTMFKGKEGSK